MEVKNPLESTQEEENTFNLFDKLTSLTQRRLASEYQVNNIVIFIEKNEVHDWSK